MKCITSYVFDIRLSVKIAKNYEQLNEDLIMLRLLSHKQSQFSFLSDP